MDNESDAMVVDINKPPYARTVESVAAVANGERYPFEHLGIYDRQDFDSVIS